MGAGRELRVEDLTGRSCVYRGDVLVSTDGLSPEEREYMATRLSVAWAKILYGNQVRFYRDGVELGADLGW